MPKLKTNKAIKKRFRVTKNGKVIGNHALRRHMLTDRTAKKKRQARLGLSIHSTDKARVIEGLPYGGN